MRKSLILILVALLSFSSVLHAEKQIPDGLKPWQDWSTWDDTKRFCPNPYSDPNTSLPFWPSKLDLQVEKTSGHFDLGVTTFCPTWIPLPGSESAWPFDVRANGAVIAVVPHNSRPAIRLEAGNYHITGSYYWDDMPQRISLPKEIGVLSLTLSGKRVDAPSWDAEGYLWLQRDRVETEDKDFLNVKVYRVIEDGIPMWLRTQVELSVAGKSREESFGTILPEGWKLSSVNSLLPVALDEEGNMKIQLRAGKWTITTDAFRLDHPTEFRYPEGSSPVVARELVAFRARPDFRMVEVRNLLAVDVTQTTCPQEWRDLPLYQWDTKKPFQLQERMRGMGFQKTGGISISRTLWLDEGGENFTFKDYITGNPQQIWRLDAAENQNLGAVHSDKLGQLITLNPKTKSPGVEVRTPTLNLEATGTTDRSKPLSATGWQTNAESVNILMNLPPGWRLFAVWGTEWSSGDWLTTWSLLDIFLLLIFTLAVSRMWSIPVGILAFVTFALIYFEPYAPRDIWLFILIPIALLKVVTSVWGRNLIAIWKYATGIILILALIPFAFSQIQKAIYLQLESTATPISPPSHFSIVTSSENLERLTPVWSLRIPGLPGIKISILPATSMIELPPIEEGGFGGGSGSGVGYGRGSSTFFGSTEKLARRTFSYMVDSKDNLQYDLKAKIQTGPGVPAWSWRSVSFGWNGPVQPDKLVHYILIPPWLERCLSLLRVVLALTLASIMLNASSFFASLKKIQVRKISALSILLLSLCLSSVSLAQVQIPYNEVMSTLRSRLLEKSDAFPTAADISKVSLTLKDRAITVDAEIHAAVKTAVPIPGRLPSWSPISAQVDGKAEALLRRDDGFLWVLVESGVHHVKIEGLLPDVSEWELDFKLKPHRIAVDAPAWSFNGVRPDGIPEQQLFFTKHQQKTAAGEASYEHKELQTVAAVDRNIELGLIWQAKSVVTRLSATGKAISLRIPLLPGEKVLSASDLVKDGFIEVRLGPQENSFMWESELSMARQLSLTSRKEDTWVESWHLVTSPIWNITIKGLPPVFEKSSTTLTPVWHPWPGESASLEVTQPDPVPGATMTIHSVQQNVSPAPSHSTTQLTLQVECSMGDDFLLDIPDNAEVTIVKVNSIQIPVRKDGNRLVIALRPGQQNIYTEWETSSPLGLCTQANQIHLPLESVNVATTLSVPKNDWVLWTYGPTRGPVVRYWVMLACILLTGWFLGQQSFSPLHSREWMLLGLGLSQGGLTTTFIIVTWFFMIAWRGHGSFQKLPAFIYNLAQLVIVGVTTAVLGLFIVLVAKGLVGTPNMQIIGNNSRSDLFFWYQAHAPQDLPTPGLIAVSIWWYRLLMLAWALWMVFSIITWLKWAWEQFNADGCFHSTGFVQKIKALAGTVKTWRFPYWNRHPGTPPHP